MKVRIHSVRFAVTECTTRMPFRFGSHALTQAPLCTCEVRIEDANGNGELGWSADLLAPKWFRKDPRRATRDDLLELAESVRRAADGFLATGSDGQVLFDHWRAVYGEDPSLSESRSDQLVRGFGCALVERAVMDATCRLAQLSFFEAWNADLFGFRPADFLPELTGWNVQASLSGARPRSVRVRHTVGLSDPLESSTPALADGLPETLREVIESYGVNVFKLKVSGERAVDLERLCEVTRILDEAAGREWRASLDGNEQFESIESLLALLSDLEQDPQGRRLLAALLYIEQPLHRDRTYEREANQGLARVSVHAPVIIDEADTDPGCFPDAVALGYRGVSSKNCKGVFRTLLNRGRCELGGPGLFQTAEDLTNLPVLALQQDLASVALLRLDHVERNGHHYFHGLDHLPAAEQDAAVRTHPDLYETYAGGVRLLIESGRISLASLERPGYGHGVPPDLAAREDLATWEARISR